MTVVQELHRRDWANRVAFSQNMLEIMAGDVARHASTYLGALANRTSVIGQMQIHGSFTLNV
jgi:hypothetical protein